MLKFSLFLLMFLTVFIRGFAVPVDGISQESRRIKRSHIAAIARSRSVSSTTPNASSGASKISVSSHGPRPRYYRTSSSSGTNATVITGASGPDPRYGSSYSYWIQARARARARAVNSSTTYIDASEWESRPGGPSGSYRIGAYGLSTSRRTLRKRDVGPGQSIYGGTVAPITIENKPPRKQPVNLRLVMLNGKLNVDWEIERDLFRPTNQNYIVTVTDTTSVTLSTVTLVSDKKWVIILKPLLKTATRYEFRVRAINEFGAGPWSDTLVYTTPDNMESLPRSGVIRTW